MASFAGAFAASHGPLLVREWESVPADQKQRLTRAFQELGKRVSAARADVLVAVSPDHWANFSLDNYPAVCIGVGETNEGPPEPWMKAYPHRQIPAHPGLAFHLLNQSLGEGFEPSMSHRLKLDHGTCIPLWRMELAKMPAIVPMLVNSIEPPMPSLARCLAWGKLLRKAIESYPGDLRVGILATGGLSHSIGEPTMGEIDEPFDRECIRHFEKGDERPLIDFLNERLPTIGNGAAEIRNWVAAHGAADRRGFELIGYCNCPEVYVGCGFASWNLGARA